MNEDIIQGSPEWYAIRLGKVTGSRIADVIATARGGWGASRFNYMAELISERLTGVSADVDSYVSPAMQRGKDMEPIARTAYEFRFDVPVQQVGFDVHPEIIMSGASPDGLVGVEGMVEFKCPNTATHIDTLLGGKIPDKYITQVQWQMACRPERKWCDWTSFDDRLPVEMQLFVKRVMRDEARIKNLEETVAAFLKEVDDKVAALKQVYGWQDAA